MSVDQIIETEEQLSDDAIIEIVGPNLSDDDTPACPPRKNYRQDVRHQHGGYANIPGSTSSIS